MLDLQKIITQKLENSKIDKRFSNRIRHFFGRFCAGNNAEKYGLGHGIFVCYAAFPVLLTPELLHKLWFNFKNYRYHANNYTIHPVAVTDVIMGGMCQEIMRNTYEMPEPIRFFLLDILQNHLADTATLAGLTLSNDNQNIVEQLAHFTKQFALHSFDPDNRFTKSTQKSLLYGADIYLSPAQTLQQIAQDFANAKNNPNQQQQLSLATDSMLQMLQQMNTNANSASATPTNYTAQLHLLLTYNHALKRFYMEGATDSVVQEFRVLLEQQTNYTTNSLLLPLPINPNSDTNAISIVLVYVPSDTALVIELKKEISKEMKDSNIAFEEILCRDENPIIDEKQMAQQFSRATTILLMLSAAALNSNSFYKTTASNAFRYCPLVIPILLRPCLWNRTPIGDKVSTPKTKTISEYKEEGTAQVYEIVAKEINHAITKATTDINTYSLQLADELLANFTGEPTQLLVLYAEEDTTYWQNLIIHVSSIRRFINVEVKSLSCQNANLSTMIAQQMATAHAVLPLLSDDFLVNSDFFIETLATQNQIPIIPILAKKCKWENSFFSTFHPTNSAPIELADNQDVAYYEISTAISRFLEEIKKEQVDTNEPIDNRKQLFFIYNQQDLEHLKNTEQHLGPLKSYIRIWHKDKMVVGDKTAAITKQKLQEADFVLPLVSTHFLADEDGIELLTLANTLNKEIMPILVDTCEWEALGILNTKTFLPISDNHTLAISSDQWEEEDNAYISIVTTIHHTVVTHQRIQEAQATNATRLDLSKLGLTEIPEGITALTHLQELDLSNNKITDISILLPLYQKGVNIVVEGNPITNPPAEVVQQGREVVLRWLEDYIEKGGIPLNEAKLIIIGAGGVGKTSLMNKLLNLNAPLPPPDATTVGITVVNQPITYTINNTEYKMHIWDFGGQDLYHPTHQFFFTPNSIYILLEDGREKKTDFYYWLHIQELLGGNSPLFILQNVRNKSRSELPLNEMRGKFGNIKEYFEMDLSEVKEGHGGFGKLVGELQANLKNLPHIGEVWPRKRYEIRDELLKRHDQNYISLKAYRKICDEKGYTEQVRQDDLLQQLHFLGVGLHFVDEPFLRDTVITNPQWATNAVYAIMDHTKQFYKKQGHFTYDDLCEAWQDDRYEGKFPQLLKLMEKFELAFPLSDEPNTYIAPLLLPDDQPKYEWSKQHSLQLRYNYDFMPKGIFSRLLVRLHHLIKEHLFWKRGMVLRHSDTEAEIKEGYEGRNLFISVKGKEAREMIYEISIEIDRINSTFHFSERMPVRKQVPCNCEECKNTPNPFFYDYEILLRRIDIKKSTIECPNSSIYVSLKQLLHEVGLDGTVILKNALSIFISYAKEDLEYLQTLKKHLSPLIRNNSMQEPWQDSEVLAGDEWNEEIQSKLNNANVVFILVSVDYFNTSKNYLWQNEMPRIIQRHQSKQTLVVPIIVRDCLWQEDKWLSQLQAVTAIGEENRRIPLLSATNKDEAFAGAAQQIKKAIEIFYVEVPKTSSIPNKNTESSKKIINLKPNNMVHVFNKKIAQLRKLGSQSLDLAKKALLPSHTLIPQFESINERCQKQKFTIAVWALVKSGKSTFLNALLGNEFLPVSNQPETAVSVTIEHATQYPNGVLLQNNKIVAKGIDSINQYLRESNAQRRKTPNMKTNFILQAPIWALQEVQMEDVSFQIMDTPGFGERRTSTDVANENWSNLDSLSIIIYLLDYTKLNTAEEENVITDILSKRQDLSQNDQQKMFFVITKIDISEANSRNNVSIEDTIETTCKKLQEKIPTLTKESIFAVSSNNAVLSRMILNGTATSAAKDDFGRQVFGSRNYKNKTSEDYNQEAGEELQRSAIPDLEEKMLSYIYNNRHQILLSSIVAHLSKKINELDRAVKYEQTQLISNQKEIEEIRAAIEEARKKPEQLKSDIEKHKDVQYESIDTQTNKWLTSLLKDIEVAVHKTNSSIEKQRLTADAIQPELKKLNEDVVNKLQEGSKDYLDNMIKVSLAKDQTAFLNQLKIKIQECANELNRNINLLSNLEIPDADLEMPTFNSKAMIDDANAFINRIIEQQKRNEAYKVDDSSWCNPNSNWITRMREYYQPQIKVDAYMQEIRKIAEKNTANLINLAQKFVDNKTKRDTDQILKPFNDMITNYIAVQEDTAQKKSAGGEEYVKKRKKELDGFIRGLTKIKKDLDNY